MQQNNDENYITF